MAHLTPWKTALATAAALLSGCAATESDIQTADFSVDVALLDSLSMAADVDWTTEQAGISWVEYGTDTTYGEATPLQPDASTQHHFTLLGLPALTEIFFRAVTEVDGVEHASTGSITTGNVPADFPNLETHIYDANQLSDEPYFLGVATGMSGILFAIDREGEGRWYFQNDPNLIPADNILQSIDFVDGSPDIVFGAYTTQPGLGESVVYRSTLAGTILDTIPAPAAHHEAIGLADGAVAWLSHDIRPWNDGTRDWEVMGDEIVEMGPDGAIRTVFSTWDWAEPWLHSRWTQCPGGYADWTHANNLVYNAVNDTYLVSLGYVSTILEIDRLTGRVLREFGINGIHVDNQSVPFNFQHAADWTPDGHLLMASYNGNLSEIFAIEYEITDANELHEVWSYGIGMGYTSFAGGQATRLENGNVLFGTGSAGVILEITPTGQVVWEVSSDMGLAFCKMTPFHDFYLGR